MHPSPTANPMTWPFLAPETKSLGVRGAIVARVWWWSLSCKVEVVWLIGKKEKSASEMRFNFECKCGLF
jgi:hypothetical protein